MGWAFADQAMISGANFVAGILLARHLGLRDYGYFIMLYAFLLFANGVQSSVVVAPMMSKAPQCGDRPAKVEFMERALALQIGLSLLLAVCFGFCFMVANPFFPELGLISISVPFAASVLLFQNADWFRRAFLILEDGRSLFITDLFAYAGQVAAMAILINVNRLSILGAYWAIAGCYGVGLGFAVWRSGLMPRFSTVGDAMREHWDVGKHLFLASQLQWAASQGMLLLAAYLLGPQAAGGIRASINIVGPINILFQVMENIVPIRAAAIYSQSALAGLSRYLTKGSLSGGLALGLVLLVLGFFSKDAMAAAYGPAYAPFAFLVVWQCIYIFLGYFFRQATYFLRTINATKVIANATFLAGVSSLLMTGLLAGVLGELGVMMALVGGQTISLIVLMAVIQNHIRKSSHA